LIQSKYFQEATFDLPLSQTVNNVAMNLRRVYLDPTREYPQEHFLALANYVLTALNPCCSLIA
jgi:hypothetical protein